MKMEDFYKSALRAGGFDTVESGGIMDMLDDPPVPAIVNQKPLMLPRHDLIGSTQSANYTFFHPLRENYMKGPSDVLDYYRKHATLFVEAKIVCLMIALLRLCGSNELQTQLNPEQSLLLRHAQKVDDTTIKQFNNLCSKVLAQTKEHRFIHMFIRKSLRLNDKTYKQGVTLTFPLYEELGTKPGKILGATISVNTGKSIREIMEYIFPEIEKEHAYSYGSDSVDAPKFEAVMGGLANLSVQINKVISTMNGVITGIDPIDIGYLSTLGSTENMSTEIRSIPVLAGNEGANDKIQEAMNTIQAPATPQMARPAQTTNEVAPVTQVVAAQVAPVQVMQPIQAQSYQQVPTSSAPQVSSLGQALQKSGATAINPYMMGMPQQPGQMQAQPQMVMTPQGMMMVPQQQMVNNMMPMVAQQQPMMNPNQIIATPMGNMTAGQWQQIQMQQQAQMQMQQGMQQPMQQGLIQLGNGMSGMMMPNGTIQPVYQQPGLQAPARYT